MTITDTTLFNRAYAVTACPTWDAEKRFPIIADEARGCHIRDTTGKQFIDFTSCSGAAPLGVGHHAVIDQVVATLRTGEIVPGTLSTARIEVAERIVDLFPCAEQAIFFRTGSCATTAAVRLARVHSGRRLVLTSGFHGWHDWHLQAKPGVGLPDRDLETIDFGYDLDVLTDQLDQHWDDVAAVIITPETAFFPHEFMRELTELTRSYGCLIIFDEVMTGFRYSLGGYHAVAEIRPDLIAISKGLANGMALSALVGRTDVLAARENTYLGYTYQREVTPFAAARASLDVFEREKPIERMYDVGGCLIAGFNELFQRFNIVARAYGTPSMFRVTFENAELGKDMYRHLFTQGILMEYGGVHMISAATSDNDIADALNAAEAALMALCGKPLSERKNRRVRCVSEETIYATARDAFGATEETMRRWWPGFDALVDMT
jgi:glutamate-1-semialdehyde 2,1-aminomutase